MSYWICAESGLWPLNTAAIMIILSYLTLLIRQLPLIREQRLYFILTEATSILLKLFIKR